MHDIATAEQRLLVESATDFIDRFCPIDAVRDNRYHDPGRAADYRRRTAELGWYAMLVPESLGGGTISGNGMLDAASIAYLRGQTLQPGPFAATNVVAYALATAGTAEHHAKVLPALITGEQSATWAAGVPGLHGPHGELHASPTDDGAELSGTTTFVADGANADWILVTATGDDGPTQYLLPAGAPGITVTPLESLDISRRFSEISFDAAPARPADIVGTPERTTELVDTQTAIAALLTAAESVGAMHRDLDMAVRYAKDRIAFGRPIGSFQAIKHVLADMSLLLETSTAGVLGAAESLGAGDDYGPSAASMVKAFVGDHGVELAQNCFQIFGGIGFTWEHDQHLYLRRITTDAALYGDSAWHREHLCRLSGL